MCCEEKLGAGIPPLGELGLGRALDLHASLCTVYINQNLDLFICYISKLSKYTLLRNEIMKGVNRC